MFSYYPFAALFLPGGLRALQEAPRPIYAQSVLITGGVGEARTRSPSHPRPARGSSAHVAAYSHWTTKKAGILGSSLGALRRKGPRASRRARNGAELEDNRMVC